MAATAAGTEAAISAYAAPQDQPEMVVTATHSLLAGLAKAGVPRMIVVGGAGSLEVAPGVQLVDTPQFPEQWKANALAHRKTLPILKESNLDWTYLSPAALIEPGQRTGKFRVGGTRLVTNDKGESRISAEDFAIVLVDELEHPQARSPAVHRCLLIAIHPFPSSPLPAPSRRGWAFCSLLF